MKESTKDYLLTPRKEGFQSVNRSFGGEKLRTPLSEKNISSVHDQQQASGLKSPSCRLNQNISMSSSVHQANGHHFIGTISPCYSSNDPAPVLVQIPASHQILHDFPEGQGFSPLKQDNKLADIIGSSTLHVLNSTIPFKYNIFSSNNCVDSPMHSYLPTGLGQQQQDIDPPFSEHNELINLACEKLTEYLRKEHNFVSGSIVLKKPRFIVELQNGRDMKEFQDSEYQKEVLRQLDFSTQFFHYDIPMISSRHDMIKQQSKSTNSNGNKKKNDQEAQIINPSSKGQLSSSQRHPFKEKQIVPQSPQYYGYPFPGYFYDYGLPQVQQKPQVDHKNDRKAAAGNNGIQPSKNEETVTKTDKVVIKSETTEHFHTREAINQSQCCQIKEEMIGTENSLNANNKQLYDDSVQVKSQFSTVKKDKNDEVFNQKRRHFNTPSSKKYDAQTPSTKKKCIEEHSSRKEEHLSKVIPGFGQSDNQKNAEFSNKKIQESKKSQFNEQNQESCNEDEESWMEEEEEEDILDPEDDNCNDKKECCGCKKTKCLKLYCECFQAKRYCVGSNCHGCHNRPEFEGLRQQAMEAIQQRNSSAFESKADKCDEIFENASGQKIHSKGCNCKKSDCRKKYCECFQMGAKCTHLCKCQNCKNGAASSAMESSPPLSQPVFFVDSNSHPLPYRGHGQQPFCYYPQQKYVPYEQWNRHHYYQSHGVLPNQKINRDSPKADPTPRFSNQKTKIDQNPHKNVLPFFEGTSSVN